MHDTLNFVIYESFVKNSRIDLEAIVVVNIQPREGDSAIQLIYSTSTSA